MMTQATPNLTLAPVISTERLILRGHRADDFAAACAMWADPIVTRYIAAAPLSGEEVWARLLRYVGHWRLLGYGYWVIEDRATGRYQGEIGFADFHRGLGITAARFEFGLALAAEAQGKGYAGEAAAACHVWADAILADETLCIVNPDNRRSLRLVEACGYTQAQTLVYRERPVRVFTRRPC
jgi:RimJ/RimL family protein N-acetyltransferase